MYTSTRTITREGQLGAKGLLMIERRPIIHNTV